MLEVNHVNKSYGGKKALQDFSCVLEPGEIYGLLGANGSGKPTLMKLIANLIRPDRGQILLDGQEVNYRSREHIAYMSTEPYFYSYMKIRDVGEYYQDFFQDFSMETFREIIDKFELRPELRAKQLSSGMMAKLKVAVTMARSADVILLDEPLNGIDLIARDQVMELIISHASKDSTLLLSSHLVEEMERFISKAIFVKDGDMVASLDVDDLRIKEGLSLAEKYRQLLA